MKTLKSLSIVSFFLISMSIMSCEKEEKTYIQLKDITLESLNTFNWGMVSQQEVEILALQIWNKNKTGSISETELNNICAITELKMQAASIIAFSMTKTYFLELKEKESLIDTRSETYWKWTGGEKKSNWWFGTYYTYPCKGHTGFNACKAPQINPPFAYKKCKDIKCNRPSACG